MPSGGITWAVSNDVSILSMNRSASWRHRGWTGRKKGAPWSGLGFLSWIATHITLTCSPDFRTLNDDVSSERASSRSTLLWSSSGGWGPRLKEYAVCENGGQYLSSSTPPSVVCPVVSKIAWVSHSLWSSYERVIMLTVFRQKPYQLELSNIGAPQIEQ